MTQRIVTNLWFDMQAEEAAEFYCSIFPSSRIIDVSRYTEAGPGEPGSVMVAEFELDGTRFVGINGGPQFTFSEAVSLQVRCMTQEEVDHYWDALTDGGEEGPCGWLKDRYGVSWQVTPEGMDELFAHSDPDAAKRDGGDVRDEEARPVALRAAAEGAPARR